MSIVTRGGQPQVSESSNNYLEQKKSTKDLNENLRATSVYFPLNEGLVEVHSTTNEVI